MNQHEHLSTYTYLGQCEKFKNMLHIEQCVAHMCTSWFVKHFRCNRISWCRKPATQNCRLIPSVYIDDVPLFFRSFFAFVSTKKFSLGLRYSSVGAGDDKQVSKEIHFHCNMNKENVYQHQQWISQQLFEVQFIWGHHRSAYMCARVCVNGFPLILFVSVFVSTSSILWCVISLYIAPRKTKTNQNKVNIIWENCSVMTNPLHTYFRHILFFQFKMYVFTIGIRKKGHNAQR